MPKINASRHEEIPNITEDKIHIRFTQQGLCFTIFPFIHNRDIIGAKEKQAAAEQTFAFHAPLMSKPSAKADKRALNARVCELRYIVCKRKASGCGADICREYKETGYIL
jgi:hypothetical protein